MHLSIVKYLIIVSISFQIVEAQIPQTISYQGVLTDATDIIVPDGNYTLDFKLYNVSSGGVSIWNETQSVAVSDGIFNVILGSVNVINLPFDQPYFLGLSIDSGDELTPRIELTASAYSMNARSVSDSSITSNKIRYGQVVKSINSLKDDIKIVEGDNISISVTGDSLTISASSGSATGNTLDQAYDQGGSGAGRNINADAGAVNIAGPDGLSVNGNVGIGTTSPVWELEVVNSTAGDGAEAGVTANDAGGAVAAYSSTLPAPFSHFGGRVSLFSNAATLGLDLRADAGTGDIRLYTGGVLASNERMRINANGNVGIGTSNPLSKLSVGGDGDDWAIIMGETSAVSKIGVSGRSAGIGVYGEGTVGVQANGSGFDFWAQNGTYGNSSSIRWKKNIVEIDKPLEKLNEIRGVYFNWDEEHGGKHTIGMIAEEVGKVLPEIVFYEENGVDAKGMDYSKLTPFLIEVTKAQQKLIEKLTRPIEKLESRGN